MHPGSLRSLHALINFGIGGVLLAGPWLFGLTSSFLASFTTFVFGAVVIAIAYGMNSGTGGRRIPAALPVLCEIACGGLLIAAPWILGFAERSWIPHLVIGTVIAARGLFYLLGMFVWSQLSDDGSMCESRL